MDSSSSAILLNRMRIRKMHVGLRGSGVLFSAKKTPIPFVLAPKEFTPEFTMRDAPSNSQIVILWRVWENCSLACRFCGYSREVKTDRNSVQPRHVLKFGRILQAAQQVSERSILVSWLGGEPLAWPGLSRLSRLYCCHFGLRLSVTTNGLPLAQRGVRTSLLSNYEQVTISIDGLGEFHDRVRGQAGLFERVRRCVERLCCDDVDGRLLRRVNTILMRGNIESFGDFCHQMADWGFHELTFNQLGGNERPDFFQANRLLKWQVERFAAELPELRRQCAARGLMISGSDRYLARIQATAAGERFAVDDCHPAEDFLFIDALGRISPCSFTGDCYGISVDDLRTVEQFLQLPERFRAMRRQKRSMACGDCHATHIFDKFKRRHLVESEPGKETHDRKNLSAYLQGADKSPGETTGGEGV
jgi:MoaA/NifB/PqqE/SkfB family radical SAM enzyme